jgi:hypothetical protein
VAGAPAGAPEPVAQRVKRRRRWPVVVLLTLIVLLVIGDRIAASAASTAAVQQVVAQTEGLGSKPTVSFGGYPFLTQVLFGKYSDIAVGIDDVTPAGGPKIKHIDAHLKGAHIPLSKAINDEIKTIPVDHVTAKVAIDFAELNGFLKNQPGQLVLSPGKDGAVGISGTVVEGGSEIKMSGSAKLEAEDGQLSVVPVDVKTSGTGFDSIIGSLGGLFSLFPPIPVPLPDLPFNLRITSVKASSSGIIASAAADGLVLDTGSK